MNSRTVLSGVLACTLSLATAACGSTKTSSNASPVSTSPATTSPASTSPAATSPAPAASGGDDYCNVNGPGNPALAFATATAGGAGVGQLRHDVNESLAAAPSEIKPDVQTIADIELPILDGKVSQAQIEQRLADPRMVGAMQHISAWAAAHCHK